jgi:hypothetical protein
MAKVIAFKYCITLATLAQIKLLFNVVNLL